MLRLGIAGIGTIANDYIKLIVDGLIPDVELTALCSRDSTHLKAVFEQYGLRAATFQNYEKFLKSGVADGVIICTPHSRHPAMTKQALEAGLHVLVEKPVGIFADEIVDVQKTLEQHPHLACGVLYNRRASKAYHYIKSLFQGGELGELVRCGWTITNLYRTEAYYSSGSWRGTWQGEGGGILMTQASHQLDLMQWICGMPVSVLARCSTVGRPIQVENEAELLFTYPNGAHGHFLASAHECPGTNLLEICGTKGSVSIRDDSQVELIRLEQDEREFAVRCSSPFEKVPGTVQAMTFDDSDNKVQQVKTIQNFVLAAQKKELIQCSMAEGLRSLQIIHGAYLSHWQGCTVSLPAEENEFRRLLSKK